MADVVEERRAAERASSSVNRGESRYSRRFAVVTLLVMVIFAGLLGFFAVLLSRSDSSEAWSSFKPKGSDTYIRAQNVANYVAPRYVTNGAPIAVVQAQPPIYKQEPVDGIAFMRRPFQSVGTAFTQFETVDKTLLYVFCGPGASCALADGGEDVTPLLREQSLELALYTFKYLPSINSVVTLLPPSKTRRPAFLFRRRKLETQLSQPLAATLPQHDDEITTGSLADTESAIVQRLTEGSVFLSSFSQTPNGHTVLLLGTGNE